MVSVAEVRRLLEHDLTFAGKWMAHLSRELLIARKRSEMAAHRTVSDRLDAWIAWNDDTFPSRGDWRALADEIGVSAEALYRELSKRRRCGHFDTSLRKAE